MGGIKLKLPRLADNLGKTLVFSIITELLNCKNQQIFHDIWGNLDVFAG